MVGGTPRVIPSCHSNKALQPVGPTEQSSAVHDVKTPVFRPSLRTGLPFGTKRKPLR